MTCKDRIHYDVCHRRINSIDFLSVIKGKVSISSIMYNKCDDVEKHCLHFKNKSLVVELPAYIEQLKNLPEKQKQIFLYGSWDVDV